MVLEVSGAAPWNELARAWQGVQADLQLPAPAIAVSGDDAYQLWFSSAEALPAAQAGRFLSLLQTRYLAAVRAHHVRAVPGDGGSERRVPPFEAAPGRWSAFVTSDLAALFADEPSLDMPPGDDAQAELLSRLQGIRPADLQRALELLQTPTGPTDTAPGGSPPLPSPPAPAGQDPRQFLLSVMNDPALDLHLRIEAAKALLPHTGR